MGLITYEQYKGFTGDEVHPRLQAESAIEAASGVITQYTGDRFTVAQRTQKEYFCEPRTTMCVKAYPITSETVTITGGSAKYIDRDSGIILFKQPVRGEVTVSYTGGMASVPEAVEMACALMTMHLLSGVEEGGKEVSAESLGDYSTTYRATNGRLPDVVWTLISKYVSGAVRT